MRKKFGMAITAALLCLTVIAAGCNMFVTRGSIQTHTSTKWAMTYSYLNGSTGIKVKLKESTAVKVSITHKSGSLTLTVKDAEGAQMLSLSDTAEVKETTLELKSGTYTFTVTGTEHSGGFSFDWGD